MVRHRTNTLQYRGKSRRGQADCLLQQESHSRLLDPGQVRVQSSPFTSFGSGRRMNSSHRRSASQVETPAGLDRGPELLV